MFQLSFIDISFLRCVTKIFCVSYYFQEKIWECSKVQLSVAVFLYILLSKGANQLQVLYIGTLASIQVKFSAEAAVLKCFTSNFFFWKLAEVLGQHLKNLLWKISQHIIQPIRIMSRFCKLSSLVFLCFFVPYINQNHKDIPKEGGCIQPYILTRMLSRPVNLNFWKSGESGFFCLKNREILA